MLDTPFLFLTSHPKGQRLTRNEVVAIYDETLTAWPDGNNIKVILRPKSDSVTPFLNANFSGMQNAMEKLRQRREIPVAATDQDNVEQAERTPNSFAGATLSQFITDQPRLRPVELDGIVASVTSMENGSYTLKMRFHLVSKQPSSLAQRFEQFLRSEQTRSLLRANGAVSLMPST